MIKYLIKNEDSNFHYVTLDRDLYLGPFSHINLFVGSNNSGKSRFSRDLISNKIAYSDIKYETFRQIITTFENFFNRLIKESHYGYRDYRDIIKTFNKNQIKDENLPLTFCMENFLYLLSTLIDKNKLANYPLNVSINGHKLKLNEPNDSLEEKIIQLAQDSLLNLISNQSNYQFLYFPILRGLRTFTNSEKLSLGDIFKEKIQNDYFKSSNTKNIEICTGLSIYDDIQKLLLGNLQDRQAIANVESFLSQHFFDNQTVALIPKLSDKTLHIKISDEKEQPIHFLGDGLQTLIIFILSLLKDPSTKKLVFIEEPEIFLHPGMQRKLLQTLQLFKNCQFFITTHSNHLLDIALEKDDLSIFTFKKSLPDGDTIEKLPNIFIEKVYGSDDSVLNLLEVRKSSVFLANCTIWVEGITDRRYLQKYLDIVKKRTNLEDQLREDVHYSFVEYGGNNITHFNFNPEDSSSEHINLAKICGKSFLIVDDDGGKKAERHQMLKECLGDRFYALQCHEIENLLTPKILKHVIAEYERVTPDDIKFDFKSEITQGSYRNQLLGKFIDKHLKERKRTTYAAESGTLNGKVAFCEKAIKYVVTIDDMSEEAIKIANKLLEFIKQNNL